MSFTVGSPAFYRSVSIHPAYGPWVGGRRPAEVIKELNKTRGLFGMLDADKRRIHLGWKVDSKPNDDAVRVFSGIWYSSPEFQISVNDHPVPIVSVLVDPENVREATAIILSVAGAFRLQLQLTAFADMAVPEVLELTEVPRREYSDIVEIYEDSIAPARRTRFEQLRKIDVERRLAQSHSTFEECQIKTRHVFAGARIVQSSEGGQTVGPGEINASIRGPGVFLIGEGGAAIDHQKSDGVTDQLERIVDQTDNEASVEDNAGMTPAAPQTVEPRDLSHAPVGRPKKRGTFSRHL
jgi:putative transposase